MFYHVDVSHMPVEGDAWPVRNPQQCLELSEQAFKWRQNTGFKGSSLFFTVVSQTGCMEKFYILAFQRLYLRNGQVGSCLLKSVFLDFLFCLFCSVL